MTNVNDSFFDGHYKDIWRRLIPGQLTEREVAFMMQYFSLEKGDRVLDLMCGYGRHALTLARHGIAVTAVDNLPEYASELREQAGDLPVEVVQKGVLDYMPEGDFKLAICMGNSLNFFPFHDTLRLLQNWSMALPAGAHLLIHSWSLAEIAIPEFATKSTAVQEGISIQSHSRYLFRPARIETITGMTDETGAVETKLAIDYIFSVNEMEQLLDQSGFELTEIYSIPGRKKFELGDKRAYLVATRKAPVS